MFSPGFNLNYNPFRQYPPPDDDVIIPDSVLQKARDVGGEFINKSGEQAYKWLYNKFYYADWDGFRFGSWFEWSGSEIPANLIDLKSLPGTL